ncbi:MAG: acyl-CoA reductase [Rikenellaceae bacterium]
MSYSIKHLIELGERLVNFSCEEVIEAALNQNSWFTRGSILSAIEAIRVEMLSSSKLTEWMSHYPELPVTEPANVLVVMAGNIPAVGFFDMLCVLMAGHTLYIKPSSKDRALILYLREQLMEINPSIPIYIYRDGDPIDAVIATGGESANLHFRSVYRGVPTILRGNRSSVAVLCGDENGDDIDLLIKDIYTHSGLGCRNVSMIFLPKGMKLTLPKVESSAGYGNNYLQQRALSTIKGEEFVDSGSSILLYSDELPTALSTITLSEYSSVEEVDEWLLSHDSQIQCVVSRGYTHPRAVGFGASQSPSLFDYPDAVDVMKFLTL